MNTNQYNTKIRPTWCPGCGNWAIFEALKEALQELNLPPYKVAVFYDIGCSSNMADFLNCYGFHGLHGRALPAAAGFSLANHEMTTIAVVGDGGIYGEGLNHFVASCRANYNLTAIVHNNQLYSLTTGQVSPTTEEERITETTPEGNPDLPFNPLATAIIHKAGFVSRGYAFENEHLKKLIISAIKHQGFSLVDVLQPCIVFNKKAQPPTWYQERIYKIKEGLSYEEALKKCLEGPDKLPIGIFYTNTRKSLQERLEILKEKPLYKQSIEKIDISKFLSYFS